MRICNEDLKGRWVMQVVELVKKHIDTKTFWKLPLEKQEKVLQDLFADICKLYNIDNAKLEIRIDPVLYHRTGGGCYIGSLKKVCLYKISLMTFLHEVAHMLMGPSEEDARLWSHKVFYLSFPKLYMENVKKGRFFHRFSIEELVQFNKSLK